MFSNQKGIIWCDASSMAIRRVTSSYIDDVYVNENVASSRRVKEHLERFGLVCKAPQPLQDGGEYTRSTRQWWWRKTSLNARQWRPESPASDHSSENLLYVRGKLVGHFPVCSWLKVAAAAIKRRVTSVTSGWDDEVHDITLRCMITETMERVVKDNPVRDDWCVDGNELAVWVDASSLAMSVTYEDNGSIIEVAC